MSGFAIIPAAPVLLDDIDRTETVRTAGLRAKIREILGTHSNWALPIDTLPPVAGLGGWGIDRGLDLRTGRLHTGGAWVELVESLTETERSLAEAVDSAIIVALLHAHATGVEVGALGSSANLLLPVDLSGAAAEEAPLAPVDGAAEFDTAVVAALTAGATIEAAAVVDLCAQGESMHANLSVLEAGIQHLIEQGAEISSVDVRFDERVHEVRSLCGTGSWTAAETGALQHQGVNDRD